MKLAISQIDAFSGVPFAGNPAAVCITEEPLSDTVMQKIANEMNLSETAFLHPWKDGFHLRWFTPVMEVDLCGHATLASAHALWERGVLPATEPARFHTRSGLLTSKKHFEWIEMDFPAKPVEDADPPPALLESLGVDIVYAGNNRLDYFVAIESPETLRSLKPNVTQMATVTTRGVVVTSPSDDSQYDFLSRFFAPAAGVNEDPVTGSAHCCLAPYWGEKLGKQELTGYQASARGGVVRMRLNGERVILSGQAVTVMQGELFL